MESENKIALAIIIIVVLMFVLGYIFVSLSGIQLPEPVKQGIVTGSKIVR